MLKINRDEYAKTYKLLHNIDVKDYLYCFDNETSSKFEDRKKQSFFINHFKTLFESLVIPLFSTSPIRETSNMLFEQFINDVDRNGTSLNKFIMNALISYKVQGSGFIIFNNYPNLDRYNENEILNERLFPWLDFKDVSELYDIKKDKYNEIEMIEFYNGSDVILRNGIYQEVKMILGFTKDKIYTRTDERDSKTITSQVNEFNKIPIVILNNSIKQSPPSNNLADINITISNQLSEQRNLERKCAFCFLQIPDDNPTETDLDIGADGVLWIPTDSSKDAKFISPDSHILEVMVKNAVEFINIFKQEADKIGAITIINKSQSGYAYEMEFLAKDFVLKNLSLFAQEIEHKIFEMFSLITGTNGGNYEIKYNQEFKRGNKDIKEKIEIIEKAKDIGITFSEDELNNFKLDILNTL